MVIDLADTRTPVARLLRLVLANLGAANAVHVIGGTDYARGFVVEMLAGLDSQPISIDELTWAPLGERAQRGPHD